MSDNNSVAPATTASAEQQQNLTNLRADSLLGPAISAFDEFMLRKGFSENTIKAFRNDLKIVTEFLGPETKVHQVTSAHLNDYIDWLQSGRGKPCSPKSLARRITTIKVFFGWLHGIGVIGTDPAEPVVQQPARPPLPEILRDEEVQKLQRSAQDYLFDRGKADSRPYLLVNLLLQTGLKKAECARLLVTDVDISQPNSPEVIIRYLDEGQAHKNRRLSLHPSIVSVLQSYLTQYKPDTYLFECTPRNLEYVLQEVGEKAGVKRLQVGFETLRWTSAVRDFRLGMPEERLRLKMGLSKISWRETREKIHKLAGR
ncbi:MAG: site-specific integrase [Caldilineaceae bacterium]